MESALSQAGVGQLASLAAATGPWIGTSAGSNRKGLQPYTDPEIAVDSRTPEQVLAASYAENITDEFLEPVRLQNSVIKDGDSVLVFNFRPDRARQIVQALCLPDFDAFGRSHVPALDAVTFTRWNRTCPSRSSFLQNYSTNCWAKQADAGLKQYRTAETRSTPTSPTS